MTSFLAEVTHVLHTFTSGIDNALILFFHGYGVFYRACAHIIEYLKNFFSLG